MIFQITYTEETGSGTAESSQNIEADNRDQALINLGYGIGRESGKERNSYSPPVILWIKCVK